MTHSDLMLFVAGVFVGIGATAVIAVIAAAVMRDECELHPQDRDWFDAEYESYRLKQDLQARHGRKPLC